ncbi:MAG: S8 family serine peptidase, partial [Actinobacteria bacterium]|nr:S8 family serine peptidase [Actinomycetota bacterium]
MRFPRTVTALVAAGTAATVLGVFAAPASADQVRGEEWWLKSVNVSDVWPGSQGAGVTVAVLSDGVVRSHQDLTNAVTAAPAINGAPAAAGQFFGEQGTPIASLIAGHGHGSGGSNGVIGVAPKATILSVPVTLPADDPALRQTAVAAAIPNAIAAG